MSLLAQLEAAGVFSTLDVELTQALSRVAGETQAQVLLAAALLSREVQAGHVCLDLTLWADRPIESTKQPEVGVAWPHLDVWRAALARSALVSTDGLGTARPLVLDGKGRLYLARYFDHEQALATRLRELAREEPSSNGVAPEWFPALFPQSAGPDAQREAVLAARARKLSMIVGGPGTGKTSTVVKLLALLVGDAQSSVGNAPRILLVAPTGKAAQRLGEAIEKARDTLPVPDSVKRAIPSQALTVHRALGSIQGSSTRFRHDREHPLECDLLLLDEASMVDLALMRRLLDAVPPHARVILLGDPDQLVSVEAGGVLGDLCAAAARPSSVLHDSLSLLTRSYRYPEGSGIAALAHAIHRQDADAALDVLHTRPADVSFQPTPPETGLGRALEMEAKQHYAGLSRASLDARLSALDQFRVLCAHRKGPASVERLNPALARCVSGRGHRPHEHYPGRPILITHNEYATQLFNGDVGVLHAEKRGQLLAHFRVGPERIRSVALARLPSHESVYAMTVHKSQGSEFEQVAIVLPERPSPVLTRELLYTAITRAKRGVSLYASEASVRAAILHRTTRSSGLADLLG